MINQRDVAVVAFKNKEVMSAKIFNLDDLSAAIIKMELDGVERVMFTYIDGLSLNTNLPIDKAEKFSCIQSITAEFEVHESIKNIFAEHH
jgi:hypothetical protein